MSHLDYPDKSWIDPRLAQRSSPIHGIGVFATVHIRAGERLVITGGIVKEPGHEPPFQRSQYPSTSGHLRGNRDISLLSLRARVEAEHRCVAKTIPLKMGYGIIA